jgi:quinol monooxygenase YgiN
LSEGVSSDWVAIAQPEPDAACIFQVTFFHLRSVRRLPRFFRFARVIRLQLAETEGLLGYSMANRGAKRFWTLSSWRDQKALMAFVRTTPHLVAMNRMAPDMVAFDARRWTGLGSQVPPTWEEGLRRLQEPARG